MRDHVVQYSMIYLHVFDFVLANFILESRGGGGGGGFPRLLSQYAGIYLVESGATWFNLV